MIQFLALLQVVCVGLGDDVTFTISGHSSGGSMASQHFVAFSDRVLGLGESITTAVLILIASSIYLPNIKIPLL